MSGSSAPVTSKPATPSKPVTRSKPPAPAAGAPKGPKAPKAPAAPSERASITPGAARPEKPNPMAEGITRNWQQQGLETSDGNKLGKYTKGGEGTIEKELLKKGFSLKEIYTKDKQGRTLAEQVAQTNGIKDQRRIADGKELKLPQRPGSKGIGSGEVQPGESKEVKVVNGDTVAQAGISKDPKGAITADQRLQAGRADQPVQHKVEPGGTATVSAHNNGTQALVQSPDNKAITEGTQRRVGDQVATTVRDADANPNSVVRTDDKGIQIQNPDGQGQGVRSQIPLGPQSRSERFGNWLDSWAPQTLGHQQTTAPKGPVEGVRQVDGTTNADGSARFNIRQANGQNQTVDQTKRGFFQDWGKSISDKIDSIFSGNQATPAAADPKVGGLGATYDGIPLGA
jgi:hypothetical protein